MNTYYFECECANFSHTFRFVHDMTDNSVWLEANLNQYLPWYKRILVAFRYVFKMVPPHEHYDTVMMRPEDMQSLAYLVDDYFEYNYTMNKEEALSLLAYGKTYPGYNDVVKGAWICNLQGTDIWVIDIMSHSGQFVRIHNFLKITSS